MTIIYAATADQVLTATILPKIAQNGVNMVRLHVDFDSSWDAVKARTAVFTTSKSPKPYEVLLSADGDCLVPAEVLTEECKLYISLKGASASGTKPSTRLTVKVLPGTPTVIMADPTPGVYQQLLNSYAVEKARLDNLAKLPNGSTTGDAEVIDMRVGENGVQYPSAGEALRSQISKVKAPLEGTKLVYSYSNCNNLIDKSRIIPGFYVDNTGTIQASTEWNMTEPIPVTGLQTLYFSGGVGLTCFYDASGSTVEAVSGGSTVTVPTNASYLIASIINTHLTTAMISKYKDQGYDDGFAVVGKKPYQDGFIPFTVPVNQTVADNSVAADEQSEVGEEYIDVDCILSLPITYRPTGAPSKLLMMCHGAGMGVNGWKEHQGYQALVKKFVDRGYAVFDCNGFKNDELGWSFWGHPRGVEAWKKAYQYVVNNYNVEQTFSIYAFSMGGLTALNLAFQNFPNIKSIALGSPVISVRSAFEDPSVKPVLQQLYGFGTVWSSKLQLGSDPFERRFSYSGKSYIFAPLPPIKIWYGGTETTYGVNKSIASIFVTAIQNAGGYAEYREVNNAGHEISYGMNEVCNIDYLLFTERYNLPNTR